MPLTLLVCGGGQELVLALAIADEYEWCRLLAVPALLVQEGFEEVNKLFF